MSISTARKSFEEARRIAEASNDSAMEHLAAGLVDLAGVLKGIETDLSRIKDAVETVRRNQR